MRINKKKAAAVVAATTVGLAGAGVAFAFWTSTGQGSGTASTTTSTAFAVASTADTSGDLAPNTAVDATGGVVDTIDYTVTNNGSGAENLSQVVISVAGSDGTSPNASATDWSAQADTSKPACTASDFSVGSEAVGAAHTDTTNMPDDLAPGAVYHGTVTLQMVDNGLNQDNCQGLTDIPLFISAS